MALPTMRHTRILLAVAFALVITSNTPPAAASPSASQDTAVQAQIDAQLREFPGGKQVNSNEISYADGEFVITFAPSRGVQYGADCPRGWFCFYEFPNYGYPRGKLSSCGWQDLWLWGWHDRTASVHYNLDTGSVAFLNHGAQASHTYDTFLFSVSATSRTKPDVGQHRDKADHVRRYC